MGYQPYKGESTSESDSQFGGDTLIVCTVTVGNIGQLANDLIVQSMQYKKVGYFLSSNVLPAVGNDPFTLSGTGHITLNLEIFRNAQQQCTILQQRAPIMKGRYSHFAKELVEWIQSAKFKRVIVLTSMDASRRLASQISGLQLRYFTTNDDSNGSFPVNEMNWIHLEKDTFDFLCRPSGFLHTLYTSCKESKIEALFVVCFCAEGNNIPEALFVANNVAGVMHWGSNTKWMMPPSWSNIEEGALLNRDIY